MRESGRGREGVFTVSCGRTLARLIRFSQLNQYVCSSRSPNWRDRQTDRQIQRQTDRQIQRQTDTETDRDRETDRQTDRQTDTETDRDRETDRQTERRAVDDVMTRDSEGGL